LGWCDVIGRRVSDAGMRIILGHRRFGLFRHPSFRSAIAAFLLASPAADTIKNPPSSTTGGFS
jgi:hypothetical protein